jgi:hypothetical protein
MSRLSLLYEKLQGNGLSVSRRGAGASSFLFVEHGGRSAEISIDNDKWWIEFWDRSDDLDAPPVKEATLDDEVHVVKVLLEWLVG